jgi:hypothetical protein
MSFRKYNPVEVEKANFETELIALVLLSLGLLLVVVSESISWLLIAVSIVSLSVIYFNRLLISLIHFRSKDNWLVLPLNYFFLTAALVFLLVMMIPLKYSVGIIRVLILTLAVLALFDLFARIPQEKPFSRIMRLLRILLLIVLLLLMYFLPAIRE